MPGTVLKPPATVLKTAAVLAAFVLVSRWPFRSHALFSWDSANFAMALDKIDIAMHRPHPPGYLGYVFVAKVLRRIFPDANTALVVWNWIATTLAALTTAVIAFDVADVDRRWMTATAATAIVLTSPLVWFYSEVAEIYPSELMCAALVAYTVNRAVRGHDGAIYAAVAALALTATFKVVTAFLLFPMVAYAWTRVSPTDRRRSLSMVALAAAIVVFIFLVVQPDLWTVATRLVHSSDRLIWFLNSDGADLLRVLNRNLRNTLTAAIIGVGLVNIAALVVWAVRDRTLPRGLNRWVAWSWALPILLFCVVLVIAKPGYLLPFVPLAAIVIGGFYARFTPSVAAALVLTQAIVNGAHFVWLSPLSPAATGGDARYRDKPLWQRMASDLQPLTFPTYFTIRESDERVRELLTFAAQSCPHEVNVIVVDTAPVDWRRVMFYLPDATAIHSGTSGIDFVGRHTDFAAVPQEGTDLVASCRVIWLSPDDGRGGVALPAGTPHIQISHLGWTTDAGTLHVTPSSIVFR